MGFDGRTEDRLARIETVVESLLQNATDSQCDAANSSYHHHRPPFQTRNVKLEFPTHAIEWIFKAEQFFEYYAIPDEDRLTIAAVHLDQKVVPWYQMMQPEDDNLPELEIDQTTQPHIDLDDQDLELHLSLNALKGSSGLDTIKFTVFVGNGNALTPEGTMRDLKVSVQGQELKLLVYLLPIVGADLILGATWLATLGPHVANYQALTLKFFQQGHFITLQGDKSNTPQQAQLNYMRRLHTTEAISEYFTIHITDLDGPQDNRLTLPQDMNLELDRHKTAFRTHHGHYECPSFATHLQHLEKVLQTLQDNTLFVKLSKCAFGVQQVDYLGHTVSGSGVAMDYSKIHTELDWPTPVNIKQLRGFSGLTGYYRKFIKSYAQIATPLTELLKKDASKWNAEADVAFNKLKQAITSAHVLALPQFTIPFTLETDGSGLGIGAVLS
ncbi:hypothetical protein TSUD_399440 [Trifolium subterraneum]|uniref:Reverse transcriptase/retrotransposon-derived protein RNase H-like domain-containing protein n=1 Tax=Trifolium subterraneum TaxID=3900 RepID=A0A2Z6NJF7_TRISU|nr:hypothetical protein TSUD_399440 [Trifolium subterraneum]